MDLKRCPYRISATECERGCGNTCLDRLMNPTPEFLAALREAGRLASEAMPFAKGRVKQRRAQEREAPEIGVDEVAQSLIP